MVPEPVRSPGKAPRFPRLPGYEIESVLGRGATGVVYRARQTRVGREVALKVLHPELSGQPRIVQRLQREARTTARLAHPHLVTAVDMGETEGRWWYAMEFVDGPSLSLRLREEGRLKEREALRLFIPLCEALEHLWEHGVVHRDIKPANILIDRAGGARLADLGLAFDDEDDEDLTKQGGTLGTPAYISPEQAVDPREADVRSDIWSFGATLFHTVCGRPPFRAESAAEVLSCVLYARVPHPQELESSLSRGLSLVLRKCLTREPEHRYQTPGELLADLERVRERRTPRIRRAKLDPVQRRHDPRTTWGVVGAIAVVALVAVAWSFRWFRPDSSGAGAPVEVAAIPFAPLEELAARVGTDTSLLALHLSELEAMKGALPVGNLTRFAEVQRDLEGRLRAEARSLNKWTQVRLDAALAAQDFATARDVIGESFARELLARTGFRLSAIQSQPSLRPLGPWLDRQLGLVESAEGAALDGLRAALARLKTKRFERVDRLLGRQWWKLARRELLVDDTKLLAEAGFARPRFPAESLAAVLDPVRREFDARRDRLDDDWRALDVELRREVVSRFEILERQLTEGGGRYFRASTELREKFERLLTDRRLERERMPEGLAHGALTELEERVAELVRIEDRLLEEAARAAFAEAERLSKAGWSERRYADVVRLWEEVARKLDDPGGLPDAPWRSELKTTAELRREEARRLRGLLDRAADRLVALDGQPITLGVRGIRYENRRVNAGLDPLENGFTIEGLADRLDLRTLSAVELEKLAGLGERRALDPEGRLLVSLLLFRDGDVGEAQRVLRAGELPVEDLSGRLALDLSIRVTDAVQRLDTQRGSRLEKARDLLARVRDEVRQARTPNSVLLWIEELLGDYGDLPEVQAEEEALLSLQRRLLPSRNPPRLADFEREFRPTRLVEEARDRVRMEFDFVEEEVGAWRREGWVFDSLGWTPNPTSTITRLGDLERGPTLLLEWPLDAGGGELEVSLVIQQPAVDPTRLVIVSAAGFHVAFVGTRLPGGRGERLLVEAGSYAELLRHIEEGEGVTPASLLRMGATHEITLRLIPRAGKITVLLDGEEIASRQLPSPDTSPARIVLRSWERISLRRATITARR